MRYGVTVQSRRATLPGTGLGAPSMNRCCITYFGAAWSEGKVKSTNSTRACWGGMTAFFTGAEGSARRRLQSPNPQAGGRNGLPAKEAATGMGLGSMATTRLSIVVRVRGALRRTRVVGNLDIFLVPG